MLLYLIAVYNLHVHPSEIIKLWTFSCCITRLPLFIRHCIFSAVEITSLNNLFPLSLRDDHMLRNQSDSETVADFCATYFK